MSNFQTLVVFFFFFFDIFKNLNQYPAYKLGIFLVLYTTLHSCYNTVRHKPFLDHRQSRFVSNPPGFHLIDQMSFFFLFLQIIENLHGASSELAFFLVSSLLSSTFLHYRIFLYQLPWQRQVPLLSRYPDSSFLEL